MRELNELQRDALTELFNMAVGRAAASLSELVGQEVCLTVPEVEIVSRDRAAEIMTERALGRVAAVTEAFDGPISGDAILLFPESQSLELVRAMLADGTSIEELTELEQDALMEIGNIILNGCIGTLADRFQQEIRTSLPVFSKDEAGAIAGASAGANDADTLLFLNIEFSLETNDIKGYVIFIVDWRSSENLIALIDDYLLALEPA